MNKLTPYLLLTILCFWLFSAGIASIPTQDRDEALYVQATKQMVQTGDYSQIKFQDKPRHLKPPGIYWLQSLSVKAFSSPDSRAMWPYRLVSLMGAWLAVLCFFGLIRSVTSTRVALASGAFLACSLLLNIEVHIANTDSVLLLTMVLMQLGLLRAYLKHRAEEKPLVYDFLLFWLAMAAGILIKGITPLVGFLTLFFLMAIDRNCAFFKAMRPVSGVSLVILLTLFWLVPVSLAGESNFLWDMIHGDVLPKLAGGQQSHGALPGYFLLLFPLMCLPLSLLLPQGVAKAFSARKEPLIRFLIAWVMPNWIFFALVPTKLPQYALPMYPAVILLSVMALFQGLKITSKWRYLVRAYQVLWVLYLFALATAMVVYVHRIDGVYSVVSVSAALAVVIFGLLMLVQQRLNQLRGFIMAAILMAVVSWPLVFALAFPQMNDFWLTRKIVHQLDSQGLTNMISNHKPLNAVGYTEPSLVFSLGTQKVRYVSLKNLVANLKSQKASIGILLQKQYADFKKLAKKAHLHYQIQTKVHGFRYNGGHWQTVLIMT